MLRNSSNELSVEESSRKEPVVKNIKLEIGEERNKKEEIGNRTNNRDKGKNHPVEIFL